MIFDAHMHLPCFDQCADLKSKKNRLLSDLDNSGVYGGIVIADSLMNSPIGNNEECLNLFNDCNNIYVMAGISPLVNYKEQLEFIENRITYGKIVGLKLYPGHETFFMNDVRLEKVYNFSEKYNVPLAVHTGWDNNEYNDPKYFVKITENYPKLKIIICHMWYPHIDYCVKITEKMENIYYDISSLAYEQDKQDKIRHELSEIAKRHYSRIIYGSDYGGCTMESHINLINSLQINEEEKEAIKWKNASKIFNIEIS